MPQMPQMPKAELHAAVRRDHRGGMPMRELERKHGVTWRTVVAEVAAEVVAPPTSIRRFGQS